MKVDDGRRAPSRRTVVASAITAGIAAPFVLRPAGAQTPIAMKLGTATLNDAQHEYLKRYATIIGQRSNGRISVEVYPASQLGSIPRMIESTQLGAIAGVSLATDFLVTLDERIEVISAPGLFRDMDHAFKSYRDPEFAKAYMPLGQDKGVRLTALFLSGPTMFNMRQKVSGIGDLKGKKIRVLSSQLQMEQVRRLEATPVPMSLGEVLPALQQGTLDGSMNTIAVVTAFRYFETAPFIIETNHSMITSGMSLSRTWLEKLPADLQAMLVATSEDVAKDVHQFSIDFVAASRKRWLESGGQIVDVPKAEIDGVRTRMVDLASGFYKAKPNVQRVYDLISAAARKTS